MAILVDLVSILTEAPIPNTSNDETSLGKEMYNVLSLRCVVELDTVIAQSKFSITECYTPSPTLPINYKLHATNHNPKQIGPPPSTYCDRGSDDKERRVKTTLAETYLRGIL